MKTILSVTLLLLMFQVAVQGIELLPTAPVEPYHINKFLQNGPTHLPEWTIEERRVPEINLEEELEQGLIERRLLQQSV